MAIERPDQPDVLRLIDELDAYQKPLYPAESHHGIDIEALLQPAVSFAVARDDSGEALGCGAVVANGDWAELKRMYVLPLSRGGGVAQSILAVLEAQARERGAGIVRLETGYLQPEALRFYERAGYVRRGPFGDYGPDPNSVFMEKRLPA
ncbi:GNAT family N-acetyltransferase [Ramlibacter sp. PS4R-6]|uniref:GNAT family N-acetyltransferase n=1 Tax=Ramlibacter sp. PS4R-6 TaxID=3133438 RepID=UPI0030B7BCAB